MTKEKSMEHILDDIIFDNNFIVVGVSAGPDSMCLLDILEKKTNKIVVCHINHNVRKESITEENYLKKYYAQIYKHWLKMFHNSFLSEAMIFQDITYIFHFLS